MTKVWKVLALLLVITALVWLTTLWRWQSTHVDPSSTDVMLHLAALPVVLTAALLAMLLGIKHLRTYAAAPVTVAPAASAAAAPGVASTGGPDTPRSTTARVLAARVELRAGNNWQEAHAAIADGDCKADLDPTLKDDDGIALFTALCADLATDSMAETLEHLAAQHAAAHPQELADFTPPDDMLRALALLESAVVSMHDSVEWQWPALAVPLAGTRGADATPALAPTVSIRVGIPGRWPAPVRQLAGAWLERLFEPHINNALEAAGQSRAMASNTRAAAQLHVHPVESAEAFWLLMEQQLHQWEREKQAGLLWALAADSLVSEDQAAALAAANELFGARNQRGRVPGEAAASLLLASSAWPAPHDAAPPLGLLHRASLARRDKSADAPGRITSQALVQALTDALQGAGIEASAVQHLTTDADHRASRTAEIYETVLELLPHLDATEHTLRLGLGCGELGIARLMACSALTATLVESSAAPAVVLGTHSSFERFVALVCPVPPPADVPAAESAAAA